MEHALGEVFHILDAIGDAAPEEHTHLVLVVGAAQHIHDLLGPLTTAGIGVDVDVTSLSPFSIIVKSDERDDDDELTKEEQEYINELKDILADGEISPRERRLLDKIRQKLGITEERAKELEASLTEPQLSEDEREYLDMYREYAEEGEITDKARRRLDKFANALGITDERVKEIEKM